MNRVEAFRENSIFELKRAINVFADDYEILNVSITADTTPMGTCGYSALVLYKLY